MDRHRYIVIEGPPGVGRRALAEKLAGRLGSRLILEQSQANPFLADARQDPGQYAFQAQIFSLLDHFKKQQEMIQLDLFTQGSVGDYLFERDRVLAEIRLGEQEVQLYDQIFKLMADRVPPPDLVVFLSSSAEDLWKRTKKRRAQDPSLSFERLKTFNEALNRFFFNYDRAPLLMVNASGVDFVNDEVQFTRLLKEIRSHRKGLKYYVPEGSSLPDLLAGQ